MNIEQQHILLIGFKHVGKSVIGKALAQTLHRPFIDLDQRIETHYEVQQTSKIDCRNIMEKQGERFFRKLEQEALTQALETQPAVISLGGGTPLNPENAPLLRPHCIIHIQAPRGIVFERIMVNGRPPFFPLNKNPYEAFLALWMQREPIYQQYQNLLVENTSSVEEAVKQILIQLGEPS